MQETRNLRLKLGYIQEDLASKIGTKYQVILQYEKGTRGFSIKRLYVTAEALFTSARNLVS
ncbi:MAG: helix-turn-helix domain-containing protein [Wolbachia sp.]